MTCKPASPCTTWPDDGCELRSECVDWAAQLQQRHRGTVVCAHLPGIRRVLARDPGGPRKPVGISNGRSGSPPRRRHDRRDPTATFKRLSESRLLVVERLLPKEVSTSSALSPAIAMDLGTLVNFGDTQERYLEDTRSSSAAAASPSTRRSGSHLGYCSRLQIASRLSGVCSRGPFELSGAGTGARWSCGSGPRCVVSRGPPLRLAGMLPPKRRRRP